LTENWAPDSSHKIRNKFFIHHCPGRKEGSFVCETVWFFSCVNTYLFDLKPVAFCPQVRRHVHKQITERRYGEEKPGRFVFGKPILFTLGLGLTAPYSLGILVWNFYQTFVILSIEFWLIFEPETRPKRFAINFLFITARAKRKVRSCVKLFDFFPGWILIRLTWNLSRFVPNSVEILTRNFRKKPFWENFSKILCRLRLSSSKTCEISHYFLQFFFGSVLHWKNSHKYFLMLFSPR